MSAPTRTIARYQHDAALHELDSSIASWQALDDLAEDHRALFKSVQDNVDGAVATKETIFHAQGGGQPSDRGIITSKDDPNRKFDVHLVRKLGNGIILHAGKCVNTAADSKDATWPIFRDSDSVALKIDSETRNYHSRLHTAGHIVGLAVRQLADTIGAISEIKANHAPKSCFVEFNGVIGGEHKAAIQEAADKIVAANRQVTVHWWTLEQAREGCAAVPDAVVLPPGEDLMRVVEIEGLGAYPCGGTHLPTTSDIGKVIVRKISRQKGVSKISYEIEPAKDA